MEEACNSFLQGLHVVDEGLLLQYQIKEYTPATSSILNVVTECCESTGMFLDPDLAQFFQKYIFY
jgi:hypothetical protein